MPLSTKAQCPNCGGFITIELPELAVGGTRKSVQYRCDACTNVQKKPSDCEVCGRKSWGLA